jgi:hypothetical protein
MTAERGVRVSQLKTRSSTGRTVAVAAAVVLASTGTVFTIAPPAQPSTPSAVTAAAEPSTPSRVARRAQVPDPEINSYVLFAFVELDFKGGNAGDVSTIDGGNIGVNESGFIRGNDWRMNICVNGPMVMSDNTMVVSDNLRMGDTSTPRLECDVYQVFNNQGAPNNEESRTGPAKPFQPPPIKATPPIPDFTCDPNNPFTLASGSATMSPGVYGNVNWQNGTTVTLTAGTYTMCRMTAGQNVTVITQPGVVLQIARDFDGNDGMHFDGSSCNDIPIVYVRSDGLNPNNDNSVSFGRNSELWGHFYAPNGKMNLGHTTDLHGTFWARSILNDWNVDVQYCPPPHPTPETGRIIVAKRVTGARAGLRPGSRFVVRYNCTIPGPGIRDALDGRFRLRADQVRRFKNVQLGTTCTAREVRRTQPLPGYAWERPRFFPSRTVTITAEARRAVLVITNPLREIFGTIRVHKEVVGDTGGYRPGTRFGFSLDCEGDRFDTTFTLAAGDTFLSDPIRVGVPCTVQETGRPQPRAGFFYQQPVLTPASGEVTISQEDQTVTVQVNNPLERAGVSPGHGTGPIAPSRSAAGVALASTW